MKENARPDQMIVRITEDLLFHPNPLSENMFLDLQSASSLLDIHPRTLQKYKKKGLIKSQFAGKRPVYSLCDIEVLAKYISISRMPKQAAISLLLKLYVD